MELFSKIKSKYILHLIGDFIEDYNYIHKLIIHSKFNQKKYDINLHDYKSRYFYKRINFENCIYFEDSELKKILLESDDIDEDIMKKMLVIHLKRDSKYKNNNNSIDIYLDSPFFECLSKADLFNNIFTINIPIELYQLRKKYIIEKFNILNKSNINYPSIKFYYNSNDDINYLKEFNINFKQLKKLSIIQYRFINSNKYNYEYFFKTLFSFNIENNLIYLKLENKIKKIIINSNIFENINNFKSLKYLKLSYFKFKPEFNCKLSLLEEIELNFCDKFNFINNNLLNLKSLSLNNSIINNKNKLKMPVLERCLLKDLSSYKYDLIVDFNNLEKLKYYEGEYNYFLLLQKNNLEEVILNSLYVNNINDILQKLCLIETLKTIYLRINTNYDINLNGFVGKNASVKNLKVYLVGNKLNTDFYYLQNIFPNVTDLFISVEKYYSVCNPYYLSQQNHKNQPYLKIIKK